MVVLLLNGAVGAWDEIAVAAVALLVLWIAVKLAGRKPAAEEDEESSIEAAEESDHPPTPKQG